MKLGLVMKTTVMRITGINTKTKAEFYKDVKVGDLLEVNYNFNKFASASYVTYVQVKNLLKGTDTETSIHQVASMIGKFDFEETTLDSHNVIQLHDKQVIVTRRGIEQLHNEGAWDALISKISPIMMFGYECIYVEDYFKFLSGAI